MFDLTFDRERRRGSQGYATPAQARAFLQMARQLSLEGDTMPAANPVPRAYFRALDEASPADTDNPPGRLSKGSDGPPALEDSAGAAVVVDLLHEAGILAPQPRALLSGSQGDAPRLGRIRAHMQLVLEYDLALYSRRNQELAYLANTILAGCSIQMRPFTAQEASDAAVAVCNLGLENWPHHWLPSKPRRGDSVAEAETTWLPDDFPVRHDLVSVFQVGWTVLHNNVGMFTAERVIEILTRLRSDDREVQMGLDALRIEMTRHWRAGAPWRARNALDVIAILDMPAWAALLGLTDECPVLHAAISASRDSRTRAVNASAFSFVSENSQIASVREFMRSLPETLRG